MDFRMNPNLGDDLSRLVANIQAALDRVSAEYAGRPVEEIRAALQNAWADASPTGSISDPELGAAAEMINAGKVLRLKDGKLMAYDPDEVE